MAGITESWAETITPPPTSCNPSMQAPLGSCIIWLIVGLFIGSLTKSKKAAR